MIDNKIKYTLNCISQELMTKNNPILKSNNTKIDKINYLKFVMNSQKNVNKSDIIILAAGMGSRFEKLESSKCIENINSTDNILSFKVNKLQKNNLVDNIYIITGHCADLVEKAIPNKDKITFLYNKDYNTANNWKSLYVGIDYIKTNTANNNDIIHMDGDLIYDDFILDLTLHSKKTSICVDTTYSTDDEMMKVSVSNNFQVSSLRKNLNKYLGGYVGITKIIKEDMNNIHNSLIKCKPDDYYEDGFNLYIKHYPIEIYDTFGFQWIEIDTVKDLEKALDNMRNMSSRFE